MIGILALATLAAHHSLAAIAMSLAVAVGINVATKGLVGPNVNRTYTAGAASMSKGLAVIRSGDDNTVAVAGANAAGVLGIIDETIINAGDAVGIIEAGECYAVIGGAVTQGNFLKTDSSGRLVASSATNDNVVAQALTSGSTAGDFIVVKIVQFIHV